MGVENALLLITSGLVLAYLVFALVRPEKF